jgi:hypothetical protein
MLTATAAAKAVAAWPDGNEAEPGTVPIGSSVGSTSGGLARSKTGFRTITDRPASAAADDAASAAAGSFRRHLASPQPPTTAMSGHFTHHIEATRKSSVSGCQRSV